MNITRCSKLLVICGIVAFLVVQNAPTSVATTAVTTVDISTEVRALDAFADGLGKLEKRRLELSKKSSLTPDEFASLQRSADDLKDRVSEVQSALQEIARKLKAADQWKDLDENVLAKITDPEVKSFLRKLGFKETLERSASRLLDNADEIHRPLEELRNRVGAATQPNILGLGGSTFALRTVRVAYESAPTTVQENSLRCRVSGLRFGLSVAVRGTASQGAVNAFDCFCMHIASNCLAL